MKQRQDIEDEGEEHGNNGGWEGGFAWEGQRTASGLRAADVASEQMTVYKEKGGKPVLGSVVLMRLVNRVTKGVF